ncbi:WD40 repeat-like protein [Meredithblackwellia eburnea MCA 4105]
MLVDYSSDNDQQTLEKPIEKLVLPTQNGSDDSDDDDDDGPFDNNDAFGINSIAGNGSNNGNKSTVTTHKQSSSTIITSSAPQVLVSDPFSSNQQPTSSTLLTRPTDSVIFFNPTYDSMTLPIQGPANPFSSSTSISLNGQQGNVLTGHIERQAISDVSFATQQRSFNVLGYAADPSNLGVGGGMVGDLNRARELGGALVGEVKPTRKMRREMKRRRMDKGKLGEFDSSEEEEEEEGEDGEGGGGEDGGGEGGEADKKRKKKQSLKPKKEYQGPWAGWDGEHIGTVGPTEEEYEEQEARGGKPLNKKERANRPIVDEGKQIKFGEEKSVYHGKDLHDYLGRTYLHIPASTPEGVSLRSEPGSQESFLPKKCIHTWSGHTKGVSRIQLFPESGHLLLSASLDCRVKLWDVYNDGKCLRTFMGHTKAVHDITFNNDGSKFLSAAFDRQVKLWDTETGQCLQAFSNGKIPYCVKFHPEQQNVFLAGMSDKKIIQYDMSAKEGAGEITQEYDQHLGPVNTINFVDENRRFVTTSDDKTIRVWDYDIPVVIKYIAEPSMHSMPAVGMHPNKKWLAMQSLDNQILIFGSDSFKQNRKKRFAGHTIAGYACEPHFSPDGKYLSSGDGQGNMVFWDWKNCRIVSKFKAHNQVVISHAWLPHETSKVITSSWDSSIKLWD